MANKNFSTTGVRASGDSVVDDWSDANCYPASAIVSLATTAINGDTWVFNENLLGLGQSLYSVAGEIALIVGVTVSSRFGTSGAGAALQRSTAGTNLLTISGGAGQTITINNLKLYPTNVACPLNIADRASAYTSVVQDVEVLGGGSAYGALLAQREGTCRIRRMTFSGTYPAEIFQSSASLAETAEMTVDIDGITYNDVTTTDVGYCYCLDITKGNFASPLTVTIKNVTGSIDSIAGGSIVGIQVSGATNLTIEDCNGLTLISTHVSVASFGIRVLGLDAVNRITNRPVVRNNSINFYCFAGDAISIGVDTEAGAGFTVDARVSRNTVIGPASTTYSPHGLAFRGLASGRGWANRLKRLHSPLMLSRCTNDNVMMYGNLITDVYGVGLSFKGNSGGQMLYNTVCCTPNSIDGSVTKPYAIWAREQDGPVANTASKCYSNNILYFGMTKQGMFVLVDTGDACTFSDNNYYSDQALPSDAWMYAGVSYGTLAAWNAAQETIDATANAIFTASIDDIIAAFGDLDADQYTATISTYGGAQKWFTSPEDMVGANHEPYPSFDIDKGACPSFHGPFHSVNL